MENQTRRVVFLAPTPLNTPGLPYNSVVCPGPSGFGPRNQQKITNRSEHTAARLRTIDASRTWASPTLLSVHLVGWVVYRSRQHISKRTGVDDVALHPSRRLGCVPFEAIHFEKTKEKRFFGSWHKPAPPAEKFCTEQPLTPSVPRFRQQRAHQHPPTFRT